MPKITIDKEKCKGCLFCVGFCPKGLIKKSGKLNRRGIDYVETTNGDECAGCMLCAIICPDCCIEVYK